MTQVRLPKFQRVPEAFPAKPITERGLSIIRTILHYRLIATRTLVRVVGGNEDVTYRHLHQLYHRGLVSRFNLPRRGNPGEFIYFLENAAALRQYARDLGDNVDWTHIHRNREKFCDLADHAEQDGYGRFLFVRHELMISDFHAGLEVSCRNSVGRIELERWVQGPSLWDRVRLPSRQTLPHRPDAFFTLKFPLAPEGQQRANFFYEADRGSSNLNRFGQKLCAYLGYLQQGKQRALGISRVRAVLVETISTERLDACKQCALELASAEPISTVLFWFGLCTREEWNAWPSAWTDASSDRLRSLLD